MTPKQPGQLACAFCRSFAIFPCRSVAPLETMGGGGAAFAPSMATTMSSGTPAVFRSASPCGLVSNLQRLAEIFALTTLGDKPAETMATTSLLVNAEPSEVTVGPPPPC